MTFNLCNEFQSLFILKTSAYLIQVIIITDIINVLFEHYNQDITSFDVMISFFKSNICMFFENVVSSTFIVFTKFAFNLLD